MSERVNGSAGWSTSGIGRWRAALALLMPRRAWRVPVLLLLALGAFLLQAAPAGAVFRPGPPPAAPPEVRSNTELVMSGTGPGQAVSGFIATTGNTFDPVTTPIPRATRPPASRPRTRASPASSIARPPDGGANLSLYCIDIKTDTYSGIGYVLGTWDAANVPNVGYVARLLNEYYPNTTEPAALTDLNQRAAAVQAAIWYFTDRYVLNTSDSLHSTVAAHRGRTSKGGAAGPAATAQPHHHPAACERPRR